MKLNNLKCNIGSRKKPKRVGRGIGSGIGKTSGRGQKGQKSRSGVFLNGYEGGQNPIHMRLPKRGFNNSFKPKTMILNVGRLQEILDKGILNTSKPISLKTLKSVGLASKTTKGIKLLGKGDLTTTLNLSVSGASASAKKAFKKVKGILNISK